jgi:hypothetical protein
MHLSITKLLVHQGDMKNYQEEFGRKKLSKVTISGSLLSFAGLFLFSLEENIFIITLGKGDYILIFSAFFYAFTPLVNPKFDVKEFVFLGFLAVGGFSIYRQQKRNENINTNDTENN